MNVIDEQEYLRRWMEAPDTVNGGRRLALNAVIGEFIGNAALAERTTRKVTRDIVRQSELTYKSKDGEPLYRDAPFGHFEDSIQVVGKAYQAPRIPYARLLEDARKTLKRCKPQGNESADARAYLLARLRDADAVRRQRNLFAHTPVLWFTGKDHAIVLDRRLSHKSSENGKKVLREELTVGFETLLRDAVLADRLGNVGAEEAVWRLWPTSRPSKFAGDDRPLVWPPEGLYDGLTPSEEA